MTEIVAEVTARARGSNEINQRSGVSVRVSIANYETLISNALRRSIRQGESIACPRISDLPYLIASLGGKIEPGNLRRGPRGSLGGRPDQTSDSGHLHPPTATSMTWTTS